jgi:hypothetical protein
MHSEFRQFMDLLKLLGIRYKMNWRLDKEFWQPIILLAGHNFTALACLIVEVNDLEFLFLNQGGIFILSRNKITGKMQTQVRLDGSGKLTGDRRIVFFTDPNQMYDELCEADSRAR